MLNRLQCIVNLTFRGTRTLKKKKNTHTQHVTCFIDVYTFLRWTGTKSATSLRYACTFYASMRLHDIYDMRYQGNQKLIKLGKNWRENGRKISIARPSFTNKFPLKKKLHIYTHISFSSLSWSQFILQRIIEIIKHMCQSLSWDKGFKKEQNRHSPTVSWWELKRQVLKIMA